jgi:hypothetical protein
MSKILVIQPHRMLRQAIGLSLFPEHDVEMTATIPESLTAIDFDAVIIDAASLQETTGLSAQAIRAMQTWKLPTVWIRDSESSQIPKWEKLVVMERPIAKDALQSSVAECLRVSTQAKQNGRAPAGHQETQSFPTETTEEEKNHVVSKAAADSKFIELVDVVEDEPGQRTIKTRQKK